MNFHVCTVCDSNYFLKAVAMYNSILRQTRNNNIIIFWLCIDADTYRMVNDLKKTTKALIYSYYLPEIEKNNSELINAKNNPASNYGDKYSQYCWTLAPWFTNYILEKLFNDTKDNSGYLFYVDADIFFYDDPLFIIEHMWGKSMAIHSHRFSGPYKPQDNGWFNVGVVIFRVDSEAIRISREWKRWLCTTNHEYYKSHGGCGDQKYLELIWEKWPDSVCIFDNGTDISHLAPWCTDVEFGKRILFYHFSHFVYNLKQQKWQDHINEPAEWNPSIKPGIKELYDEYFIYIQHAALTTGFKLSIIGNMKIDEQNADRLLFLKCTLKSFEFLKNECEIILNFQDASPEMQVKINEVVNEIDLDISICFINNNTYGNIYLFLLDQSRYDYVLNFIEDHFCVMNDPYLMKNILKDMFYNNVDVCRASFFEVEQNSIKHVIEKKHTGSTGFVYENNEHNHKLYCSHYERRYYLGVNFITKKDFAEKFWSRHFDSKRPHEWEISNYDPAFEHKVLTTDFPLLMAIDDDHGEPGTCLLSNVGTYSKFQKIFDEITAGSWKVNY